MVKSNFLRDTTNQKHYLDLGNDVSSVWNFFAHFSDVICGETSGSVPNVGYFLRLVIRKPCCISIPQRVCILPKKHLSHSNVIFPKDDLNFKIFSERLMIIFKPKQ